MTSILNILVIDKGDGKMLQYIKVFQSYSISGLETKMAEWLNEKKYKVVTMTSMMTAEMTQPYCCFVVYTTSLV